MGRVRHTTRYPGIRYRLLDEARPDGPRRYIIGYTDANGEYHTETLPVGATLDDAKARKAALEGVKRTFVPVNKTVGELLDEYLEARKSSLKPSTYEVYAWGVSVVKDEIGNRDLKALTPNDLAKLIATLQDKGHKTWTIKKLLTPLVGALKVALREGWITSNPADRLLPHERPKADQAERRILTPTEIEVLLGHASSARWRALFALLTFTGLRISEALRLRWDDIGHGSLIVRVSKTEAGTNREVIVIPRLQALLNLHRLAQPPGTEYVFATRDGTPLARRQALVALRAAEKSGGLPDYTLHELRHTFASMLIAQGETPALVADQMGHANPAVTMTTYAKLFDAQKNVERARERLQSLASGMAGSQP